MNAFYKRKNNQAKLRKDSKQTIYAKCTILLLIFLSNYVVKQIFFLRNQKYFCYSNRYFHIV